jgi:rhodanese-related sulfurtransferase
MLANGEAAMSVQSAVGYAGDLPAIDAYGLLSTDKLSMLIDVRTQAEWTYVGTPDLTALNKTPLFLEWQRYPSMQVDGQFAVRLRTMLESASVDRGTALLFLCRSGSRSRAAAIAMTAEGWAPCFNVSDGFEGQLDRSSRKRCVNGWKTGGLPWIQT